MTPDDHLAEISGALATWLPNINASLVSIAAHLNTLASNSHSSLTAMNSMASVLNSGNGLRHQTQMELASLRQEIHDSVLQLSRAILVAFPPPEIISREECVPDDASISG